MKVVSVIIFTFMMFSSLYSNYRYEYKSEQSLWIDVAKSKKKYKSGDIGEAIKILQDIVAVSKDYSDAHYELANIYFDNASSSKDSAGSQSAYQLAIVHYEAVIKYNEKLTIPTYFIEAYFRLFESYAAISDEKNRVRIQEEIERIAYLRDDKNISGRIHYYTAEYYEDHANYEKAKDYYEKSFSFNYRKKYSLYNLACMYRKIKNTTYEKYYLWHASRSSFEYKAEKNIEIDRYINTRLKELEKVELLKRY